MYFVIYLYNITAELVSNNETIMNLLRNIKKFKYNKEKNLHLNIQNLFKGLGWKKEYRTKTPVKIHLDLFHFESKIGVEIEFHTSKVEKKIIHFEYLFKKGLIDFAVMISFYDRDKKDPAKPYSKYFINRAIPLINFLNFKIPLIFCLLGVKKKRRNRRLIIRPFDYEAL